MSGFQEILLLKKDRNKEPRCTYKPKPSSVLADVKNFLPRLALSNQHLKEAVESGENVDIENVEDTSGPVIQMDLALVKQDSDCSDSDSDSGDSSDESIQGEVTEENLRLRPRCKNKPNIEVINTTEKCAEHNAKKAGTFEDG